MKIALIKDFRDHIWCSHTILWSDKSDIKDVLKSFLARTQGISLIYEFHADIYVIAIDDDWYYDEYDKTLNYYWLSIIDFKNLEFPSIDNIDFGKYDLIICSNPWISDKKIRQYPNTLFSYWDYINPIKRVKPEGAYDLQLNHLEGPQQLDKIPQEVYLPYPTNTFMGDIFKHIEKKKIGTEFRTIKENKIIKNNFIDIKIEGLETIFPVKGLDGYNFYCTIASYKYFIYIRNWMGGSGQAALEAASLGSILIGYHCKRPFNSVIHPFCKIESYSNVNSIKIPFPNGGFKDLKIIEKKIYEIENNILLYNEILEYQNMALNKMYQNSITIFEKALKMKKGY